MTPTIGRTAEHCMKLRGFNNFSAYVAQCIRENAEKLGVPLSLPDRSRRHRHNPAHN